MTTQRTSTDCAICQRPIPADWLYRAPAATTCGRSECREELRKIRRREQNRRARAVRKAAAAARG